MPSSEANTPFSFNGLDRVFHERARLGIVTSLAGQADGLTFAQLKQVCGLTDGNLNRHLAVLQEAGYLTVEKSYFGKRPQTRCQLSAFGRRDFTEYLAALESALREATRAAGQQQQIAQSRPTRLREPPDPQVYFQRNARG